MNSTFTAARSLVHTLAKAGVRRLFTLSGNQILSVFDACRDEGIELIHVRHEAAAVHMADAWGRLTGEPGVALVTAGPGFANTLSALYVARMAESPLILLAGQAPRSRAGRGAFQDLDQQAMSAPVTKFTASLESPEAVSRSIAQAWRASLSGRPGPVHLACPGDVLTGEVGESTADAVRPEDFIPSMSLLDRADAQRLVTALTESQRPLILLGPAAMRGAGQELARQVGESLEVPVLGMESPRGIHDPRLGAFAEVLPQADLIVLVGKRLDFTLKFAEAPFVDPACHFIHIDPEPSELERTAVNLDGTGRLVLAATADPWATLQRIVDIAAEGGPAGDPGWKAEVEQAVAFRPREWATLESPAEGPVHPVELCRAVAQNLTADRRNIVIVDGGEFGQWCQACLSDYVCQINGPSGSIGGAIPFAIAARLAFPDARVITLLGDGTFGFHAMEFDTAVRYGVPFVAIVGNDACWNAEYQLQIRHYGPDRTIGCELLPTSYEAVVEALGGCGERVSKPSELPAAISRAVAADRPACVNVAVPRLAAPAIRRTG